MNTTLETLTIEYNLVRDEIKSHTNLIKQALCTIQDSKDKISELATRLSDLQAQYFELEKDTSNESQETKN